jgi:two-component system NarL family sensor kinase
MDEPAEVTFGLLVMSSIGFMLLAACALLAFLVAYQRRQLQQRLLLQRAEAAHQQELLSAIIEAQEGERERIGQDLHDGIGSLLATAKLLAGRLGNVPADEDPAELHALIQQLINTGVQDVRSISHSLYPAVLARYGLAAAIRNLADISSAAGKVPIALAINYTQPLPLAQELALYRICQELVHNALKHAKGASRLTVQLQQRPGYLALSVEDNGPGFPLPEPGAPVAAGVGLRSLELRVQLLGARLQQESIPGQGVRTVIELA